MNLVSGIFTAPVTGTYHFQFTGVKDSSSFYLDIFLQVNGFNVGFAYTDDPSHTKSASVISLTASLRLKVNDKVNLYKRNVGILFDSKVHHTHFTGWLVDEELIQISSIDSAYLSFVIGTLIIGAFNKHYCLINNKHIGIKYQHS